MIKDLSKNTKKYNRTNSKLKIAIVKSLYHQDLTASLEKTCKEHLIACGVKEKNITSFETPGSWEIPLVAKKIAFSKKVDGIITFGVIIKGETYHFEMLANECARALMSISLKYSIPITLEILAVYTLEQARKRSIGKYNKGIEAAETMLDAIIALSNI